MIVPVTISLGALRERRAQRGGFLLEALVGILIFTLGVLGLVALQARAIAYTGDAQHRGEAAYLANSYISKMWADSRANIPLRYVASGQPEFDALEQAVFDRLPGASGIAGNPSVTIVQPGAGGDRRRAGQRHRNRAHRHRDRRHDRHPVAASASGGQLRGCHSQLHDDLDRRP